MNETINAALGTVPAYAETLLFIFKTVVLLLSIWLSISVLSNFFIVAGREAAGKKWKLLPSNFIVPSIMWTLFWILTQIQL